ncbi:hypothetical protein BKA70DRAFT_1235229 [Coprinopsis sp. MPI-PUGE-AT-0042]|nr:hypothetical protein BKA70DRAFT_1235229 [Coprinopsis sp. MPI-PUGE-AT-0042]
MSSPVESPNNDVHHDTLGGYLLEAPDTEQDFQRFLASIRSDLKDLGHCDNDLSDMFPATGDILNSLLLETGLDPPFLSAEEREQELKSLIVHLRIDISRYAELYFKCKKEHASCTEKYELVEAAIKEVTGDAKQYQQRRKKNNPADPALPFLKNLVHTLDNTLKAARVQASERTFASAPSVFSLFILSPCSVGCWSQLTMHPRYPTSGIFSPAAFWCTILPFDVQEEILWLLPITDLQTFMEASPESLVVDGKGHLKRRLIRVLARVGLQYDRTSTMLERTSSLLTGSPLLDVVSPTDTRLGLMEIACQYSRFDDVVSYCISQGYGSPVREPMVVRTISRRSALGQPSWGLSSPVSTPWLPHESISGIFLLHNQKGCCTLRIIRSASENAVAPVVSATNTLFMNWATHQAVFCAYPALTMAHKGIKNYLPWYTNAQVEASVNRFRELGFSIYRDCRQMDYHDASCCRTERERTIHIPDGRTRKVPALNPYCSRRIRRGCDETCHISALEGGERDNSDRFMVEWRLVTRGCVAASTSSKGGWVEVDEQRYRPRITMDDFFHVAS